MVHDTEFLIKKFESTDSFTLEMTSLELQKVNFVQILIFSHFGS